MLLQSYEEEDIEQISPGNTNHNQLFQGFVLDCQTASSLSFSSDLVWGVHVRPSVELQSRETRETRVAASPVSCLQSCAWSFACLRCFAQQTKEKERLLIVQICAGIVLKPLSSFNPCPSLLSVATDNRKRFQCQNNLQY